MTLAKLPRWAGEMLASERVARLSFVDDQDRPRVLPVTFAMADDAIWSAIDSKPKREGEPARVRWLRRRPHAALLVDRYADEWESLAWVQLLGTVAVLDAADAPAGLTALEAKYPQYADEPPPGPVLRFGAERSLCWRASGA